jgi:hypothetical protein
VEAAFNAFERIENDLTDQVFDVSFYEEYIKNPGAVLKEYCSRA